MTTIASRLTIDEFLAAPETKPYREYLRGEVTEKPVPNLEHGELVANLIIDLGNHLRRTGAGILSTEVRHADLANQWVFLPDISVTLRGRLTPGDRRGPVRTMPDFAIEVLSPDDRASYLMERVEQYMAAGVRLLWIVDPDTGTVSVYRPGEAVAFAHRGDSLEATPVLPGFVLDVATLFPAEAEGDGVEA